MLHREHKEEDGYFLGRFVKNSLNKYQNGYLPEENIKKLEEFPDWEWSPKENKHKRKITILVDTLTAYHKEHDHLWVPPDLEVDGENIMNSMEYYRARYRTRNPSKKEIRTLESIPGWTWETPLTSYGKEMKWEQKYQLLLKYALQFGHTNVPQQYEMNGEKLGIWVDRQRILFKKGRLLDHRLKRLEKLSVWFWEKVSCDDLFSASLYCLIEYYQEHGAKMPPYEYKTERGTSLNEWISTQRKKYHLKILSASEIRRLEAVPGWAWSSKDQNWNKKMAAFEYFNDRFGHCEIPLTYKAKGVILRHWVNEARLAYVKDELKAYQREALEKLKGWQDFVEKSLFLIAQKPLPPSDEAVFRELEIDEKQSLTSLSRKTGYAVTTCSACRKRYFQQKE